MCFLQRERTYVIIVKPYDMKTQRRKTHSPDPTQTFTNAITKNSSQFLRELHLLTKTQIKLHWDFRECVIPSDWRNVRKMVEVE